MFACGGVHDVDGPRSFLRYHNLELWGGEFFGTNGAMSSERCPSGGWLSTKCQRVCVSPLHPSKGIIADS